ncbi:MAG: hypothetical protein V1735_05250 [Nanoarchaeota archaeon]
MNTKEFLSVDFHDIWNWILGIIAIGLLWWGISTIVKVMSVKP